MLTDLNINEFINTLSSSAPAPGGGAAAGLCGSIGIALIQMVVNLTLGKEKYKSSEALMNCILLESSDLKNAFLNSIDNDAIAFNQVAAVFKMPKTTDEEKALRKDAMQNALKNSALPPFEIMEYSLKALELTNKLIGTSNTNVISDIGVAALALKASLQSAWLNVLINLKSINDKTFVENFTKKGELILSKSSTLADEIYINILNQLK